tara:strand:- start:686 stop:961 length:276 start_codon:yes stop_codon:yes gene_type:complete
MKANRIKILNINMKFIFTLLFTFIFSVLINTQSVFAGQLDNPNELDEYSSDKIENIKESEKSSKTNKSEGDIFGDEQTFPFVAGLGKNAAH